jgi:hypothetical protein
VRAASQRDGWNSELAGRAAAALRLAGAVALSRPVGQKEVERNVHATEGQVASAPSLRNLTGKKMMLSGAVTPGALNGKPSASPAWESVSQSLGIFSAARYGRSSKNGDVDATALDAALADAQDAVRRLRFSQWRRFGRSRRATQSETTRPLWER